jgi:hypothetical protein
MGLPGLRKYYYEYLSVTHLFRVTIEHFCTIPANKKKISMLLWDIYNSLSESAIVPRPRNDLVWNENYMTHICGTSIQNENSRGNIFILNRGQ